MIWSLLLLIPVLLFIIRILPVQVQFFYRVDLTDTHRLVIKIMILRIPCWKRTIQLPTFENFLKKDSTYNKDVRWKVLLGYLKKVKVNHLYWETGIGTGEAHITGIIAGMIWTGKEVIIHTLEKKVISLSSSEYMVKPNYHGEGFYSQIDCDFCLPLHTLFKLRNQLKKDKKK